MHRWPAAMLILALGASAACARDLRRFPLAAPLWVDDDDRSRPNPPAEYATSLIWDGADNLVFAPVVRSLAVVPTREAVNVNALDEVPDSSWYTNRLAIRDLTLAEIREGACAGTAAPRSGSWTITSGKSDGNTPGFFALDPDGQRYVLKVDGPLQPETSTGADAVVSRLYWAAGYNTPCNRVVRLARSEMRPAPNARFEAADGSEAALDEARIDTTLRLATVGGDGRYRLSASRFVDGRPLGPFRYEGVREDDANDSVPHEDRRDLRAARVLAAWVNHWDAREQNTLTTWVEAGDGGFVRHFMLDFSDTLGQIYPFDTVTRRMGHGYYVDPRQMLVDFASLGLVRRPWDRGTVDPVGWIFCYFNSADFTPDHWHAGYPNAAFNRMTERDAAWMARIVARISDAHLRAVVTAGQFSTEAWSEHLVRVLAGRRDALLARYLTRVSPLSNLEVHGDLLCGSDRARQGRVYTQTGYVARFGPGARPGETQSLPAETRPAGEVCVRLVHSPLDASVRDDDPSRYRVLTVATIPDDRPPPRPLRVHLYDLGPQRGFALAGLER